MASRPSVTIAVTGMTCAACQARVQRALAKTPGVDAAAVNLMMNNAAVTYDPAVASPERLVDAIRATGYGAELPAAAKSATREQAEQDATRRDEFRDLRNKAAFAFVVGVVTMAASMSGSPMSLMSSAMTSAGAAPLAWWLMLVATSVVMVWAGRDFYVRAWKALRHGSADMNTLISVGTGAAFVFSLVATLSPGVARTQRRAAAGLLRSGGLHHRVRAGGSRASKRARRARRRRRCDDSSTCSRRTARVIRDGVEHDIPIERCAARRCRRRAAGRAHARSTERSSTAAARSTNRC